MSSLTTLADDLTGACEIAALGFRRGRRSVVALEAIGRPQDVEVFVIDTESRMDTSSSASTKVKAAAKRISSQPGNLFFKKTDSALRGPIRAELTSLARARHLKRILLVPANPQLGRLIRGGMYEIGGIPLDQTEFASDPHHPARSSDVRVLLGGDDGFDVHSVSPREAHLPENGLIVGDVTSPQDLHIWADRLAPDMLAAGGAAFCDALLDRWMGQSKDQREAALVFPDERTLLISGTLSATQRQCLRDARPKGLPVTAWPATELDPHSLDAFGDRIAFLLARNDRALAYIEEAGDGQSVPPESVSQALSEMTARLVKRSRVDQLVVEGGSTAAAIALRLRWTQFAVTAEWGAGTVSLQPNDPHAPTLTVKPGSYPWPPAIAAKLFAPSHLTSRR